MNIKDELLSVLEIAEINFLMAFKKVKPELVTKQIMEDTNYLAWIIGHCVSHFDSYLSIYTNERLLTKDEREFYAFGVSKAEIKNYQFSFVRLIDTHLEITERFFSILEKLESEKFGEIPHKEARESLADMMKRIALHIMGHTGQIVLLRRMFDDPFWNFVGGVQKEDRTKLRREWVDWWEENKSTYR